MAKVSLSYPDTGLTVNLSIINQTTEVEDFSGVANEIGTSKTYVYTFTEVSSTDYTYVATVTGYNTISGSIFAESSTSGGLTQAEHDQLFAIGRSMGGGSGFSEIFKSNLANTKNEIIRKIQDSETNIESKISETNSHIDTVKIDIIDEINNIEIPENKEIDISIITEGIGVLKSRFTKLSEWLKTEQKNEMDSKDKENEGKISELQSKIDEMEEAFEEMEGMKGTELEEKQKLIDEMEKTAQEIIIELEKEKTVNKEATEKEIKDKLISSLSK